MCDPHSTVCTRNYCSPDGYHRLKSPVTDEHAPTVTYRYKISTPGAPTTSPTSSLVKQGVPSPDTMTIDFLITHLGHVKKFLSKEQTPLSAITENNIHPVINKQKGKAHGKRFVEVVCKLGLGHIESEGTGKNAKRVFKRHHPEDDECPDRENVHEKYTKLGLD